MSLDVSEWGVGVIWVFVFVFGEFSLVFWGFEICCNVMCFFVVKIVIYINMISNVVNNYMVYWYFIVVFFWFSKFISIGK